MSPSHPRPTGWRLLPWQHLASAVVPAGVLLAGLVVGQAGSHAPTQDPPDPVASALPAVGSAEGLWVVQSRQGYVLLWQGDGDVKVQGQVPCDAPCQHPDDWDTAGLVQALRTVKRAHPEADTFTLSPAEDVPFRAVTDSLQAARFDGPTPLFPYAVVSRR